MKTQLTLKSFTELSIEKLAIAMPLPPPPTPSHQQALPATSRRYLQPVALGSAEEFAPVHLPNRTTNRSAGWNHWGLNE